MWKNPGKGEEAACLIWQCCAADAGAGVLASVTGSPYAAQRLLAAHSGRNKRAQQQLLKPQNTGARALPCTGLRASLSMLTLPASNGLMQLRQGCMKGIRHELILLHASATYVSTPTVPACLLRAVAGAHEEKFPCSPVLTPCKCLAPGGSDADGTEYAGALSQRVFQTIASAADDMAAVFGDDAPELSSLLVVWALQVAHAASDTPFCSSATQTEASSDLCSISSGCYHGG